MATFYKGAGPGTHWWMNDPRAAPTGSGSGFTCAAWPMTIDAIVRHITAYSHPSPFLSFSQSFAVAREYALVGPAGKASASAPGYVYEVELDLDDPAFVHYHPVKEIGGQSHQLRHLHDGGSDLILAIAAPSQFRSVLMSVPPRVSHTNQYPPVITQELRALIFSLRDAELLTHAVSAVCIRNRHSVY